MSFRVEVAPVAYEALIALIEQVDARWGNKIANQFKMKVGTTIIDLADNLYQYPVFDELRGGAKMFITQKSFDALSGSEN